MIPSAVFAKSPRVGCLASWLAMNWRLLSISAKSVHAWSVGGYRRWGYGGGIGIGGILLIVLIVYFVVRTRGIVIFPEVRSTRT